MQISRYVRHMIENDMDLNQFVWTCTGDIIDGTNVEFYEEKLKEAKECFDKLDAMTLTERIAYGKLIKEEKICQYRLRAEEELFNINKCRHMITLVRNWEPPTKDHIALKEFMLNELLLAIGTGVPYYGVQTMEFEELGPLDFFEKDFMSAKTRILCMEENLQKEKEKLQKNSEWISALIESVGYPNVIE